MALDLVALLALFAFAWLGAHRGGAEAGVRLVGLAIAYGGSLLAGKFAGGPLGAALGVAPWLGLVGAGLIGFVAAQALVEVAARKVRAASDEISDASRVLGSLLGIARGGLLLLPLLWLAGFTESVRQLNPSLALPDFSGARAAGLGQAVAAAAAEPLASDRDSSTRMTAKFVAQPGVSVAALSAIVSDTRIRVLQADAGFWRDLENGQVERALARPTFTQLALDAELRARLADLGLIGESSVVDAQQFHREMAAVMAEVGPRIQRIKADPAFQELLADESLRARIQAGDTLSLLSDPRIQRVAASAAR
jgi:hypothetical protein